MYLAHHGIKGQKWGIRRFQNPDGTLTHEGRLRYGNSVFISGSSKTQTKGSGYYRKELPKDVKVNICNFIGQNKKILVGDAPGIDRQVQDYLNKCGYKNVEVFSPGTEARYLANPKWTNVKIDAPEYEKGSSEWLAKKDIAMSKIAAEGFAITLDEGSTATKNNIHRMREMGKKVVNYELSKKGKSWDGFRSAFGIKDDDNSYSSYVDDKTKRHLTKYKPQAYAILDKYENKKN